jgi:RimJ/RimL family protein N-acetyltransferase
MPSATRTTFPTAAMANSRLLSVFGQCEPECAARVIVQRAREARTWAVPVAADDFRNDAVSLRGYCDLRGWGWMDDGFRRLAERVALNHGRYGDGTHGDLGWLRPMRAGDVRTLYGWYARAPLLLSAVPLTEEWLRAVQADETQWRWSLERHDGNLAGMLTLWRNKSYGAGVLSPTLLVDPAWRGRGFGRRMLAAAVAFAQACVPEAREVRATVFADNLPSLAVARHVLGEPERAASMPLGRRARTFRYVLEDGAR